VISIYKATFDEDWPKYFDRLDDETKERVSKKIKKILEFPEKRHLKGNAKFFIDEIGQNRITYRIFKENEEARFYFVGNHKEYEKWYRQFF
jgi:mRNA-degrading endonuclease RelE of RelBE toxin-antitoxin system